MVHISTVQNLRLRYFIGLSAIAFLVTTSFIIMQTVVSKQRDYSKLINLAGHQSGLTNRIAYFASLMASTGDESEFGMARAQVGRTIHKIQTAYSDLRNGNPEKDIPMIMNERLNVIYEDPMVGLDRALSRFLERAQQVYDTDMESLTIDSIGYIFLTTYGPHVLEPLLDAAVEEYEKIGREAIVKIEKLELIVWLTAIATLLFELGFIFRPFERQIKKTLQTLETSITQLTDTKKRLIAAQKLALLGDWELDTKTGTLTWSDQIYEICGVSGNDFEVTRESSILIIHPDDRMMVEKALKMHLESDESINMEFRILRPDGQERLVFQHTAAIRNTRDQIEKIVGTIQDITERKELSARLEKLSCHIPGFLFQFSLDRTGDLKFNYASTGIINTCGLTPDAIVESAEPLFALFHDEDRERVIERINESRENLERWNDQYRIHHPEKGLRWLEGHATPERLIDGGTLWHGYIWDITERKNWENQIEKLALYDSLTGLANRRLIKDRLSHAITTSRRNKNYGAVLMLDLDNFKSLNDTKGHNVGDALLVEVADRLQGSVRETDTVGRLGGDEFVIVLELLGADEAASRQMAMQVAEKIRINIGKAYILGKEEHVHNSTASIGVSLFQDTDLSESESLKRADVAMYEAKDLGRNCCCFFNEKRQALVNSRTELAHALQRGVENKEFSLFLQPQFLKNGCICGAEALIRWTPPGKDPVPPGSFIPIAENSGLIIPLGAWVLEKACQYLNELKQYPIPGDFSISVNISARQLVDENFIYKVKDIFNRSNVKPGRIKLELTESCLVQDMDRAKVILDQLHEMGLSNELDDFGTGYSSLNSINHFPLTALKLDRSLINGIEKKGTSKAVVRTALALAKAMSLSTVAEGVETKGQIDFLVNEGCEMFQGFYYNFIFPSQSPSLDHHKGNIVLGYPGS